MPDLRGLRGVALGSVSVPLEGAVFSLIIIFLSLLLFFNCECFSF